MSGTFLGRFYLRLYGVHDPSLDEPVGRHPLQLLVQLLRRGHPEVGDRGVEALGEVVSGGLSGSHS